MDENMNTTVENEGTTPQTETVEGAAPAADPTPAETPETQQQTDTTPEAAETTEQTQTPATSFLPVKFRHEMRDLTREDAAKYAQMGLLREAEQPMLDDLALMAAARGQKPAEFFQSLKDADAAQLMEEKLLEANGDRTKAERLVSEEMNRRREALNIRRTEEAEAEKQEERDIYDRLAGELLELQKEFPDLTDLKDLPVSVVNEAFIGKRHLLDAYLRYMHREGKNIEQNRAAQAAAAAASVGSQADKPTGGDPAIEAMIRAVRNA